MQLDIEDLDDGCLPCLDVELGEEDAVRTLRRPLVQMGGKTHTVELGGLWEKPEVQDGRVIIQMVELDSDSLQFILKLMDPRNRDKIKRLLIVKRKAATFGMLPMPKEPCKVGVAAVFDLTDPATKERVQQWDRLLQGWKDKKMRV